MPFASSSTNHLGLKNGHRRRFSKQESPNIRVEHDEPTEVEKPVRKREKLTSKHRTTWAASKQGWVKEGFRRFGNHCARNQVGSVFNMRNIAHLVTLSRSEHYSSTAW